MGIFTFPGTNYHDLNLDWLITQMKNCLAEWETVKGQFSSLQEYVANYFANLDVSEEISAKLDEMAASGELLAIASSLIQSTTTDYLASVITNPNSPPLDRTLTQATAAAPADMVGDLKDDSILFHTWQPADFSNLSANIREPGCGSLIAADGWTDLPTNLHRFAFFVWQFNTNYYLQFAFTISMTQTWYPPQYFRIVNADGTVTRDWTVIGSDNVSATTAQSFSATQTATARDNIDAYGLKTFAAADYNNHSANIFETGIGILAYSQNWDDLPVTGGNHSFIFSTAPYTDNYAVHFAIPISTNLSYDTPIFYRIVTSSGTVYRDWSSNSQALRAMFSNYLSALFVPVENKIVAGYNSANSRVSQVANYPYIPVQMVSNILITRIGFNCETAGIITIGYYPRRMPTDATYAYNAADFTALVTLNVTTGPHIYPLNTPISIPDGYALAVGAPTDTATFRFGPTGTTKQFWYRSDTAFVTSGDTTTCGFDVYGYYGRTYVRSVLAGKSISIYGDSISTYANYIPEGNAVYYNGNNCGVSSVSQTWWMETINALGLTLCVNQSWSGRTVSSLYDENEAYPQRQNSGAWRTDQVAKLANGSVTPDIIIVKLGINDFNGDVALGSYDGTQTFPEDTAAGASTFREAYAIMLKKLQQTYPRAKIYVCTLMQSERKGAIEWRLDFPEKRIDGTLLDEFNKAIIDLAQLFGVQVIDHGACGITLFNLSEYAGDYSQTYTGSGLHPNAAGMALIADCTIEKLDPAVRIRYS